MKLRVKLLNEKLIKVKEKEKHSKVKEKVKVKEKLTVVVIVNKIMFDTGGCVANVYT